MKNRCAVVQMTDIFENEKALYRIKISVFALGWDVYFCQITSK